MVRRFDVEDQETTLRDKIRKAFNPASVHYEDYSDDKIFNGFYSVSLYSDEFETSLTSDHVSVKISNGMLTWSIDDDTHYVKENEIISEILGMDFNDETYLQHELI